MDEQQVRRLTVPQLLGKLNELYDKEDKLKIMMNRITIDYNQLQEDKELLQMFIMHKSNKNSRG